MNRLSLVSVVLGSALLFSGSAHAYQLSGYMWNTDDLPLKFFISDYLEDSLPQAQNPDNGLYYQEEALLKSYCNWHDQDHLCGGESQSAPVMNSVTRQCTGC